MAVSEYANNLEIISIKLIRGRLTEESSLVCKTVFFKKSLLIDTVQGTEISYLLTHDFIAFLNS